MVSFLMILGSIAMAGGGIGYFAFPLGLRMSLKMFINLDENGMVYPLYMEPPFATLSTYYLFAITNPREVLRGAKMKLQVKGPYHYKAFLLRDNISFYKKGEQIKYDSHRKLHLDEQKSRDLDEKLWMLNPILLGTHGQIKSILVDRLPFKRLSEPIVFNSVNVVLDNFKERLIVRTTPRTVLEGRKVEILESVTNLATRFGVGSLLPPGPPDNMFGLAYVQNETVDTMKIWTGVGDTANRFGEVLNWRNKPSMTFWRGSECNKINGTNGELYKPFIEEGSPIKVFLAPLCRSFYMVPTGDGPVVLENGIRALEYELAPRLYQGVRTQPSNRCFCVDARTYDCQYDGLMSMGPCFFDTPLFFARANFKGMDRKIRGTVDDDLTYDSPVPDKQSFYIEPITGTVLRANLTLLAVFKMVRQPYMRDLAKVQNLTYAPMFAVNERLAPPNAEQLIEIPFELIWQIYALQKMVDYYKPIMLGTALSGTGMLALKFLV